MRAFGISKLAESPIAKFCDSADGYLFSMTRSLAGKAELSSMSQVAITEEDDEPLTPIIYTTLILILCLL